jgi:hypothetical protein
MSIPTRNGIFPERGSALGWLAWGVALVALLGSLYLSIGMRLNACPLCLYQRTFVMGVVGVLAVGLGVGGVRPGLLSLVALPLATAGAGVAGYHTYLEYVGRLECPDGILGLGSAPQQAVAAQGLVVLILLFDILRSRALGGFGPAAVLAPVILGGLFVLGAIRSSPPPCPPNYDIPLNEDGCRKPNPAK